MSGFESLILGEKTAVVFDIGTVYTKCGFAGETGPRFILSTEITTLSGTKNLKSSKNNEEKRKFLILFLHNIYYRHLLVNPKDRRVVIIESVLCSTAFRNLLADVLFNHFEAPSLLFAPAHLVALFTLGISSALVLDCGYNEAQVIPVCEGYTLLNAWQSGNLGSKAIHENMKQILVENSKLVDESKVESDLTDCPSSYLSEYIVEDIKVRTCFVSPHDRAELWKLYEKTQNLDKKPELFQDTFNFPLDNHGHGKLLQISTKIRELSVECLHTGDNDQITLANLILRSILITPIDVRRILSENIVLIGGTVMLPGFKSRLMEELNCSIESSEFTQLLPLKGCFKIHNPPAEPNYVAWLGGAIFGALECLPGRSLNRTTYLECGTIPDWCNYIDFEAKEMSRQEVTRH